MFHYINTLNILIFLVSIVLFLRGIILFLLLLLFDKIGKKKVVNGMILGISFMIISIVISKTYETYFFEKFSKIIEEIAKTNDPSKVKILINGINCENNKMVFINDLFRMKEGKEKDPLDGNKIIVKIVIEDTEKINLEMGKYLSIESEYFISFKDLSLKSSSSQRSITTTYISACLKEKPKEKSEKNETGSETK